VDIHRTSQGHFKVIGLGQTGGFVRKYWMADEVDLLTGYRSEWRDHSGSGRAMSAACVPDGRRPLVGHYRYAG
jgi:hypothetical protein